MLAGSVRVTSGPVLESKVEPAPPKRKRPWWLVALIVVGALAVLGVAGWFLGRGLFSTTTDLVYTPAYDAGDELPSGLRVDLQAEGGSQPGTVSVLLTLRAPKASGLTGEIMVVFPLASDECQVTTDDTTTVVVTPSLYGVELQCGFAVPVSLPKGGSAQSRFTASGVTDENLSAWLNGIRTSTSDGLSQVTGSGFWLQRIQGLAVNATAVKLEADGVPVPYSVQPVWPSGLSTEDDVLFSGDTLDYQATDVLLGLTGGDGFGNVDVSVCGQAQVNGHRVIAVQPSQSCELQVRVGGMSPARTQFFIEMKPS